MESKREPGPCSERELIERSARGDVEAITCLYKEHSEPLLALAYRITISHSDAEDVVHDVFLALPKALSDFTYKGEGSFGGWLRKIAERYALTVLRKRKLRHEVPLPDDSDDVPRHSQVLAAASNGDAPWHVVDALPQDLRVILMLRMVQGRSYKEIGESLGISSGNAMVRLHRAKKHLQRLLDDLP